MLDLCRDFIAESPSLKARAVYTVTGDTSPSDRVSIYDFFKDPNDHGTVLLLLIQVGGLGLNLTAGHYGIFMEPAYNPQAEKQAEDRMWRLGQESHVTIFKLVVEHSIEQRIVKMQTDKLRKADLVYKGNYLYVDTAEGSIRSHITEAYFEALFNEECEAAKSNINKTSESPTSNRSKSIMDIDAVFDGLDNCDGCDIGVTFPVVDNSE